MISPHMNTHGTRLLTVVCIISIDNAYSLGTLYITKRDREINLSSNYIHIIGFT